MHATTERARASRDARPGLLAVPVQGGSHPDLRACSARSASEVGDVLAVGGVVPLHGTGPLPRTGSGPRRDPTEPLPGTCGPSVRHRPPDDVRAGGAIRSRPLRFVGLPQFARRGSLMFPEGTVPLDEIRENACHCFLCAERPLPRWAAQLPAQTRSEGGLPQSPRFRRGDRTRASGHPRGDPLGTGRTHVRRSSGLRAGLKEALANPDTFLPVEPEFRRAFREAIEESIGRPVGGPLPSCGLAVRSGKGESRPVPRFPRGPNTCRISPTADRADRPSSGKARPRLGRSPWNWPTSTPSGRYLGVEEFLSRPHHRSPRRLPQSSAELVGLDADLDRDWTQHGTNARSFACSSGGTGARWRPVSPRAPERNAPDGREDSARSFETGNPNGWSVRTGYRAPPSAGPLDSTRASDRAGNGSWCTTTRSPLSGRGAVSFDVRDPSRSGTRPRGVRAPG